MFDVMPLRNWRLLALVLAFICAVSHLCVAGPIIPCIEGEQPVPLPGPLSSLFPRPVPFPQLPTAIFQSDGVNLRHITAPPDFECTTFSKQECYGTHPANSPVVASAMRTPSTCFMGPKYRLGLEVARERWRTVIECYGENSPIEWATAVRGGPL